MNDKNEALKVTVAPNGFYPRTFRWQGRLVRVLSVERVVTTGTERRCRVRTGMGYFELGLFTDAGIWRMRRAPGWLGRLWARWQMAPRYPLPAWRRRARRVAASYRLEPAAVEVGGCYADRFALVRQ